MDLKFLVQTELFRDCAPEDLEQLLERMEARTDTYQKDEVIFHTGQTVRSLGLVLEGRVRIEAADAWGKRSILGDVPHGAIFAETYAVLPREPLLVDVTAAEDCSVLLLNVGHLLAGGCTCPGRDILIRNFFTATARKNLGLSRRIFYTAPKTIRERLLLYLSDEAVRRKARTFAIPFDRQQLADYLGVDRSALSAEIGRMARDGLIEAHRHTFRLLQEEKKE